MLPRYSYNVPLHVRVILFYYSIRSTIVSRMSKVNYLNKE